MQHQPQQTASLSASLSEALHELLQSRPHAGREVADALLELLSPWELLYLRRRVSSFQLDGQAFASWPDLPQEIIVEIVAHLSLSDLLTSRLVSREWKKTWLSDYVINRYLKRSHPGVIESSPAGMPRENLLMRTILTYRRKAPNGLTGAFIPWFTRQAPQISTTRKGTPVFQLSLDLVYHHEQSGAPRPLYSGGKVAWHLPSFRFGVDDIRAAQRVIYTLSIDRRRSPPVIQMAAFTGKMLVVSSHSLNSTKLHILHLDHEEWSTITLSARLHACYAQGESLVAVCRNKQAVHWSWGKSSVDIAVRNDELHAAPESSPASVMNGFPGALFHPHRSDILFLVHIYELEPSSQSYWDDKEMFTAVAIKYEQRDPNRPFVAVQRYSHQMPRTLLSQVVYEPFDSLGFQWFLDVSSSMRQINNHGSYSLFYFYSFYRLKDGGPYNIPYITTLCFNVLTEKFSCPALAFPTSCAPGAYELRDTSRKWHKLFDSRLRVAEQVHIWNGEFFSLSWETERSKVSPPSLNSTKLMDEDLAGDQLLRALNDAPRSEISSFQDMPIEEDDEGRSRTPIIWGSCYWRIFGDDNMLVVLTDNGYYVVHCRGDNRKFDWLLEGLGRRVGRGAHLPDLGHGGLRDVLFRMSHRYGDTRAGSWSDDEDPEYNIEAHE